MQQEESLQQLLEQLSRDPSLAERMPSREGAMVRAAMAGKSVHEIASDNGVSEGAVWQVLGNAARQASGQEQHPVETGGLGSEEAPADDDDKAPRPSQAEGEVDERNSGRAAPTAPRPSQAEGELADVEANLRQQERNKS